MQRRGVFAGYTGFLMLLGAALVLLPLIQTRSGLGLAVQLAVTLAVVVGVLRLPQARPVSAVIVAMAAGTILARFGGAFAEARLWTVLELASGMLLILLVAGVIVNNVWRREEVTFDTVVGGLAAYVLLAAVWANAYELLEFLSPGSFVVTVAGDGWGTWEPEPGRFPRLFFFSFVTLTTLGYGDVVPGNVVAGILTSVEAVLGPVYLTVLIARLVALEIATARTRDGTRD